VVVHHVEDHLDPGAVQFPHQRLELLHLAPGAETGSEGDFRSEEGGRVVPPVVREPFPVEEVVDVELVHGEQLDGVHAEGLKVRDLLDEAQVRSRVRHLRGGVGGESLQVGFVDHHPFERDGRRGVPSPVEPVVHHDRLRDDGLVFPAVEGEVPRRVARVVGQQQVVLVDDLAGERLRVRVDQQLPVVEPEAPGRVEGTPDLVPVELAGAGAVDENVPGEPVPDLDADDVGRVAVGAVEEEEPHLLRGRRVEGEVDPSQPQGGAQGIVPSRRELPVRSMRQVVRHGFLLWPICGSRHSDGCPYI
jgi:hypothetical protein